MLFQNGGHKCNMREVDTLTYLVDTATALLVGVFGNVGGAAALVLRVLLKGNALKDRDMIRGSSGVVISLRQEVLT